MHEISAVLAGTTNAPNTVPASSNINVNSADTVSGVDPRRYSQYDRTASKVGDAEMSFGDFLDMVNPLQHIPVVSSVYRAITGDTINPVSRVAGDMIYGGALGVASAILSGIGGIADSVMEAKTGKDVTGTVYAALFGNDAADNSDSSTQLAATEPGAPVTTAPESLPPVTAAKVMTASAEPPPTPVQQTTQAVETTLAAQSAKAFPLNRNNLPYGGAMAPVAHNFHDENLVMSVSKSTGLSLGNTRYANYMKNGMRALPPALQPAKAATTETTTPADTQTAENKLGAGPVITALPATPVPDALKNDAWILKALGAYQNVAASTAR